MPQPCNESPPAAREKGDPQAGQRGRLFAAGISVAACFFLCRPFERLRSGLFLGVSLSAAARSAAALVYDKLTPNCHLLNLIWKKADINYGACLYVCIEFSIISKRAVQRIVPLPNARFPVVYRSPADSEFGTHFCLPHSVHIAIQDGKFQCG